MKKRLLTLSICFALIVTMFSIASVSVSAVKAVDEIEIFDAGWPYVGAHPSFEASINAEGCGFDEFNDDGETTINGISWVESGTSHFLTPNDTFEAGKSYRCYFQLRAFEGCFFPVDGEGEYNGLVIINNFIGSASINSESNTASVWIEIYASYPVKLSSCKFGTISNKTYTGSSIKPKVKVTYSTPLEEGVDYTVSYSNNKNIGKAKVTIKGIDGYTGTKVLYFKIVPKSTYIKSLTGYKKSFKVKWGKRTTQTSGYQIRYSTASNFSNSKTVTIRKTSTTYKTIKNLKAKKYYYVKVRTYKTVNGVKYYSNWSIVKKVKTK